MLYDAINVFEKMLNSEFDNCQFAELDGTYTELERKTKLLVDNYIPANGTYMLINIDKNFQCDYTLEIGFNEKTRELKGKTDRRYNYIRYLDYNSKLISTQKPIDIKKIIHSNQIYSFWIKKESIPKEKSISSFLNSKKEHINAKGIVDGYYNTLAKPEIKYKNRKTKELYEQALRELEVPDIETLEKIHAWIKAWLEDPSMISIDLSGKDYLKLFFVYDDERKTKELFEKENRRYIIPKIYNNNDYNVTVGNTILGMPNNNINMNDKKPFLENKNRKTPAPYLMDMNRAILQSQFFDYLWGHACKKNVNVYIDFENEVIKAIPDKAEDVPQVKNGLYLRIKKGKEVEILDSDVVINLNSNLKKPFYFKRIIKCLGDEKQYGEYNKTTQLATVVDEVFFDKCLGFNYFTDPLDLSQMDGGLKYILLTYRSRLFAWLYRTPQCDMGNMISDMALRLIKNKIADGYFASAGRQLNLLLSLQDYFNNNSEKEELMGSIQEDFKTHIDMLKEDWEFSDSEYYYAVGQMISYFLSLSKSAKKPLSMANQFLNANSDYLIKEKLSQMFIRYNYAIDAERDIRAKNVINHIMTYEPECKKVMQRELIAGLTASSAFYMKKE